MFNWWLGRGTESNRVEDENTEIEPPETPAPIFAARALKSAIFGTPGFVDEETIIETQEKVEKQAETMVGKENKNSQSGSMSPTKPPGILLTPGTATSRRKTVSFGTEVTDKEEKFTNEKAAMTRRTEKDPAGVANILGDMRTDPPSKSTRLTKAFENAREGTARNSGSDRTRIISKAHPLLDLEPRIDEKEQSTTRLDWRAIKSQKSNQDLMQELVTGNDFDADMTVDLNEPHSQSGKFWKSEYEQYHEEARTEMKKLIKYKHLAKSFAKKKDAEALDLAEKLKEEQRRVVSMEDKISKLSTQIAITGQDGKEDDTPELIKELARQTALAVQYRSQVEEFQAALEGDKGQGRVSNEEMRFTSPRTEQTLLDTHRELKKARDQLKEMAKLREEICSLKQSLSTSEQTAKKLQEENTKLTQELLHADFRLEKEIEKTEKRKQGWQERLQKKDELFQSLQKDYDLLKESAKLQRRDAEHLLKKRHDQAVELKRELASMRFAESTARDLQQALQKNNMDHDHVVADYQRQIDQFIKSQAVETIDSKSSEIPKRIDFIQPCTLEKTSSSNENSNVRDSLIPVLSQSIARPSKTLVTARHTRSEAPAGSPGPLSSHSALSEITNNASKERLESTPSTNRISNLSLDAPDVDLPSPEPYMSRITGRIIHERNYQASPRPSMFVIPSSPPKPAVMRSRTPGELARQRSIGELGGRRQANLASSRLSSLEGTRTRATLPPERAAAAKARLEQKNAEKKRAQATSAEKENVCI